MPIIVFHWQRIYSQAAELQAVLEGREPTMEDLIADGSREPTYRFTAFAVPPPSILERDHLCRLIEAAGFRKDSKLATWIAPTEGEQPAVALKTKLDEAKVSATHYHAVPTTFIVAVNLEGCL